MAYHIDSHSYPAHLIDYVTGVENSIGREEFDNAVSIVKGQCKVVAELLISQLDKRFPNLEIKKAFNVVFPHYWLQEKCDELFLVHLQVIKDWFCNLKVTIFGVGDKGSHGKLVHLHMQGP